MNKLISNTLIILAFTVSCSEIKNDSENTKETILKIEKSALERWLNGDVWGFLDLFSDDATYIDEGTKLKLHGVDEIKKYIEPWNGKIYVPKYEIIEPVVRVSGDFGILTYNLYNFNEVGDTTFVWNCTELYENIDSEWKISHSHWSIVKKE